MESSKATSLKLLSCSLIKWTFCLQLSDFTDCTNMPFAPGDDTDKLSTGRNDLPAVDEVGCRVEESSLHRIRVVCVLSCQNHPLLSFLTLKHLPLLRRAHQQHKVRCGHIDTKTSSPPSTSPPSTSLLLTMWTICGISVYITQRYTDVVTLFSLYKDKVSNLVKQDLNRLGS